MKSAEVSPEEAQGAASETAAKTPDDKPSPEEAAWRERVAGARERLKAAERAAEEGELLVTEMRNYLASPSQTTRERNQAAADLDAAGVRLTELRREAQSAKQELDSIVEEGRQKRFTEAPLPEKPPADDAKGNEDYFRKKFIELSEKAQTAQRRLELYENRIREINQRMQNSAGSGDNFFLSKLQEERDQAEESFNEAQAAYQQAQQEIEQLKQEGRRAGVAPGVFR
jgi:hypothetical protein